MDLDYFGRTIMRIANRKAKRKERLGDYEIDTDL